MDSRPSGLTMIEMLSRLVAFDTESSKTNLPLIDFVEDYLQDAGVRCTRFPNAEGDKAALYASVGPSDRGGVILSGHTDVVPVAGQVWSRDPFKLHIDGGRAYGRGAVDMKTFDALAILLMERLADEELAVPLHLLLSYDEETTCLGSTDAIAVMGRELPMPVAAIVGEPTELQVADAHKSCAIFTTWVHGSPAHSAKPYLGANAVMAGGEIIAELNRISDDMERRGDSGGRFDPPYTTVQVGEIHGGTARNILAEECVIKWEFRGLPDLDPEEIPRCVAKAGKEIERTRLNRHGSFGSIETVRPAFVPGLRPDAGSRAERLALGLTRNGKTITVSYATEAGHFQEAGIPTVVCGPGSINAAHQADEFITLEQIAAGEAFMQRLRQACLDGAV